MLSTVILLATVGFTSVRRYLSAGFAPIQGRYVIPAVTGLAVAVSVGVFALAGRRTGVLLIAVGTCAAFMQYTAIRHVVEFYWGDPRARAGVECSALVNPDELLREVASPDPVEDAAATRGLDETRAERVGDHSQVLARAPHAAYVS